MVMMHDKFFGDYCAWKGESKGERERERRDTREL